MSSTSMAHEDNTSGGEPLTEGEENMAIDSVDQNRNEVSASISIYLCK